MIEAPNRGSRRQLPPDREQVRANQTPLDGHIGARWIIRSVAPIALPPIRKGESHPRAQEQQFCHSFCVVLLLFQPGAQGLSKGVPTAQARESLVSSKIRREQRSAWFKNISRFVAPA